MTKILKYQLLKLPFKKNVDWSEKDQFEEWSPNENIKKEIVRKIGNVNRKRLQKR